jgi:hypothetical protein
LPNEHINLPGINEPVPLAYVAPPPLPQQSHPTPQQLVDLQDVGDSYRAIRKTAAVANFSGITTVTLAVATAAFTAFSPDALGIFATLVLGAVGIVEILGRKKLLNGDENATKVLALNQLGFLAAIVIYCIVQMGRFSLSSLTAQLPPEIGPLDPSTQRLVRQLWYGFYILLIVLSLAFQGGLALYYHRCRKHVARFAKAQDWEKQLVMKIAR